MNFKHLFIPDHKEKKRAHLVRNEFLLSYLFFIFALFVTSSFVVLSISNVLGYATDISVGDLLNKTNDTRAKAGLSSLKINSNLSKAAEMKANDMFDKDYWAHTSPTGKEPWDFIIASGYDYLYAGENLAVDFSHSKSVVDAWYESPSHRANLMNDKYTEIGFAVVNGELQGRKTTLVVQMFGYPRNQPVNIAAKGDNTTSNPPVNEKIIEKQDIEIDIPVSVTVDEGLPLVTQESTLVDQNNNETFIQEPKSSMNEGSVLNTSTVFNFSRFVALMLGLFITSMFAIDGYYVKRNGILRITGHTFFHIVILIFAIIGMWYTTIGLVL